MQKRAKDIKEKLAFTLSKYKGLMFEISASQKEDKEVPFIGDKTGDILSGCRECFDYCAKDIADSFIAKGNDRIYFPYHQNQLSNKRKPFFELTTTNPPLHKYLLELSAKIKNNQIIPNTIMGYGIALELNEMVNEKKHDKIIVTNHRENSATQITSRGGTQLIVSPLFPFSGDAPDFGADINAMEMIGTEGVEIKYVKEYRLLYNNWEVIRFCLSAIQSTRFILSEIYQKEFGMSIDHFNPIEYFDPW